MYSFLTIAFLLLAAEAPELQLGRQLFQDTRFSSPQGDMQTSCQSCHAPSDPQGNRAFTELLSRSWMPWRREDPRRETLRNTPTIIDAGFMPLLHMDGELESLEEQARTTLTGRNFGWLPGEHEKALDRLEANLLEDSKENTYPRKFLEAYGVELESLSRDELLEWAARAISDYVRSLTSTRTSAYDEFLTTNRLDQGPYYNEDPKAYAERLLAHVASLEKTDDLRLNETFGKTALQGMKIFFRSRGDTAVGNCAACHVPPAFTDFSFHNTGVVQDEYDAVHGTGKFNALEIPDPARVKGPVDRFLKPISAARPGEVDLGYWNFADRDTPPNPRGGNELLFLRDTTIASFKTPTLRNLRFTDPYMHSGNYATLEGAVAQKVRVSFKAGYTAGDRDRYPERPRFDPIIEAGEPSQYSDERRENDTSPYAKGKNEKPLQGIRMLTSAANLRNPDADFSAIQLSPRHIAPLVAFLDTLNEKETKTSSGLYVTGNAAPSE